MWIRDKVGGAEISWYKENFSERNVGGGEEGLGCLQWMQSIEQDKDISFDVFNLWHDIYLQTKHLPTNVLSA